MADDAPRLYVALYADADIHGKFVSELRKYGYDAISSREANNDDLMDPQQLEFAVRSRRAILTHNTQHFEPLHQEYLEKGKTHYGIVVCNQIPLGELLRRVLKMLNQIDSDEMKNTLRHLGEFK